MSKATIIRKSFNGGEIAPELHFRSDVEKYHNSCKTLKNVLVTPWGTAVRRPPTKQLHKFDTATYGVPIKYLPFRFSISEAFNIVFTDGSGSASPDSNTADIIVLDDEGALQILDGASTYILNTPYDPADLINLHHIQVNDFVYMTCGGAYPEHYIFRFFDSNESANRWKIKEQTIKGGPFEEENTDENKLLFAGVPLYSFTETYNLNDVVFWHLQTVLITSCEIENINAFYGVVKVTTASSIISLSKGDRVLIEGVYVSSAGSDTYSVEQNFQIGDKVVDNYRLEGPFYVRDVINNTEFTIDKLFYTDNAAPAWATLALDAGADVKEVKDVYGFYKSIKNNNTGQPVGPSYDPAFWQPIESYQGIVNVIASFDAFASTDVGRTISIQVGLKHELNGSWNSNKESFSFNAQGRIILETSGGAWSGVLELLASYNGGGTYESIGEIRSADGGYNGSIERDITNENVLIKVRLSDWAAPSGTFAVEKCLWTVRFNKAPQTYFKITSYIDSRNVQAETISPLRTNAVSHKWQFGAFSQTTGYPRTLAIHEERKIYGGTKSKPNTVWGSAVNDFNNFLSGDLDTSPYTFTIKSDSFDSIRWMRSTRNLIIGTENSESIVGTRDESSVISSTNVDVQTQTYFGSSNIQAVVTADQIYFVQGQNERVRTSQYDFGTDQYLSSEVSLIARHITESGIREMSFRRHPYNTVFFILNNGKAISLTYERENLVQGWSRIELSNAEFISASANYSETGDIIVGIVKRGSDYFLEKMGSRESGTVYLDSQVQFVDEDYSAGVSVPWSSATGLTVVRNGAELTAGTDYTISGGTLTIPAHTDGTVNVGYKFDWCIEPTDFIEFGDFGSTKRASKLSLYLLESGGCNVEINGKAAPFKESLNLSAGSRLNGQYELSVGGGYDYRIQVKLFGNDHKPFNLSAIGMYATRS